MNFNTTIVTAFVSNVNQREGRDINKYLEQGKHLLNIPIPKIIFLEPELLSSLENILPEFNYFIPFSLKDIYLYSYLNSIENKVKTDNPKKDTLEYFMVQCNKTEWVKKAIELNIYKSKQFIWIDFGIYQFYEKLNLINDEKPKEYLKDVIQSSLKTYDNIRIPHIWNLNSVYNIDLKKNISWYFAGSLFGGDKDKLLIFADKMKEYCLNLVENEKILFWEVNIWYFIYNKNKELFNLYYAGHDVNIFKNY